MKFNREYKDYLQSNAWKSIRKRVIKRDGGKCTKCGNPPKKHNWLEVHHLHYGNFGCEQLEDLVTLCRLCHVEHHRAINKTRSKKSTPPSNSKPKNRKSNKRKSKKDKFRVRKYKTPPSKETVEVVTYEGYVLHITEKMWQLRPTKKKSNNTRLIYVGYCPEVPSIQIQNHYRSHVLNELVKRLNNIPE